MKRPHPSIPSPEGDLFRPQITGDGSFTFFSEEFDEAYHSHFGAFQEAQKKFVEPTELPQKAEEVSRLILLDICYGLGYNTAAALAAIWAVNPACEVELIAIELDPEVPKQAITMGLLDSWGEPIPSLLADVASQHQVKQPKFEGQLLVKDARIALETLCGSGFKADAIFLDPFSPPKCPQLWTVEFLSLVGRCLNPQGKLATYSCAASVRSALSEAGLYFGSTPSFGRKSPGTVASFNPQGLPPLSVQELEHQQTRGAIPYRDPHLSDPAEVIIRRRQEQQDRSDLETTSQWKKRWATSRENLSLTNLKN